MADLIVVPSSVLVTSASSSQETGTAGEAIDAGDAISLGDDSLWYKAGATEEVLAGKNRAGIALNTAATGQPIVVCKSGTVALGVAPSAGEIFVVSAAGGGIAPNGDLATTNYLTVLGYGNGTDLVLDVNATGIQHV